MTREEIIEKMRLSITGNISKHMLGKSFTVLTEAEQDYVYFLANQILDKIFNDPHVAIVDRDSYRRGIDDMIRAGYLKEIK